MKNKWLIVGVAVAIVLLFFGQQLYDMAVGTEFKEGAPSASIRVMLDDEPLGTANVGSHTAAPATTYTADVPPVDPGSVYRIGFVITTTSSQQNAAGETFETTVTIKGHNDAVTYNGQVYGCDYDSGLGLKPSVTMATTNGQPSSFSFTTAGYPGSGNMFQKVYLTGPNNYMDNIKGAYIDGSVFTIDIITIGSRGHYGQTTATIQLVVGEGGTVAITIGDITTTVEEGAQP